MQPLAKSSDQACLEAARDILAAVPEVMYYLRGAGRCGKAGGCTIPQIRTLVVLDRYPQTTLSHVADCLGVTLPTASRLVSTLGARKLITRRADPKDRRNVCLCLTATGRQQLNAAREWGRQHIAGPLRELNAQQVEQLAEVMKLVQRLFRRPPASGRRRVDTGQATPAGP